MGSARLLYERFRQLIHEAAKFGIIGVIGVFVNIAVSDWMHYGVGVGATSAAIVGGAVTTVMSYLGNRYWSFRHRERTGVGRETAMFFVLNGVGLGIQGGTVYLITHGLNFTGKLDYTIANILGIVLGTLFRFWSYRKWVWADPQATHSEHEVLEPAMAAASSNADRTTDGAGSSP